MDKKFLLEESKVFCILPWIHINSLPSGAVLPCCISKSRIKNFGSTVRDNLETLVNSDSIKRLRFNMLQEADNPTCQQCYSFESQGIRSFRQSSNEDYSKYFDETVPYTQEDGSIVEFKMRYFDIRFSNICNFKCRTCGSDYSSQWEIENNKNNNFPKIIPKNNRKEFLEDVLRHIPYLESVYFAGGEPLITEEHYIMLEEMIKSGRTDIRLTYNTNLSNFKFKNRDILSLWKNFTNGVFVSASIDHFGARAEYIRNGTEWDTVESNLRMIKSLPHIRTTINTVVSLYNYYTLDEFYDYLIENNLYAPSDTLYTLYNMSGPLELTSCVLPEELKKEARSRIKRLQTKMEDAGFPASHTSCLESVISWAESRDLWQEQKNYFKKETLRLDSIRNEDFCKTFPELAILMDQQ